MIHTEKHTFHSVKGRDLVTSTHSTLHRKNKRWCILPPYKSALSLCYLEQFPEGYILPCAAWLSQKQPWCSLRTVKNNSWKLLKTFIQSHSTERLPKRSLCAHQASVTYTMMPHKDQLATQVCPACLQTLATFWGLFDSHRGDTGSEAEMTDRAYKDWLPAHGLLDFSTAWAEGSCRKILPGCSLLFEVT